MDDSSLRNNFEEDKQDTSTFMDTEWTDEKHSLFLKSMETTFVNQLYKSLDLLGRNSQKNTLPGSKSSKPKQTSVNVPSGKFKVFRDGNWSKINFMRDEPQANQEEESRILSAKPWIQHYRSSSDKRAATRKSSKGDHSATTLNQFPVENFQLWRQESVDDNTEVTGQNFIDDELEEDKKSSPTEELNITKASAETVPNYDQVVPSGNIAEANHEAKDKS